MKIGIAGGNGRMGRAIIEIGRQWPEIKHITALVTDEVDARMTLEQQGLLAHHLLLTDSPEALVESAEVVIDFSRPEMTIKVAEIAAEKSVPLVSGTTGFTAENLAQLKRLSEMIPLLWSANMSVGVALLRQLVKRSAAALPADYDIEVLEMHHRHKVDAPSGTALSLGRAAAEGRGIALEDHAILSREGQTDERPEGAIGFAALRGGQVIGDHTVIFAGEYDRIELSHYAASRHIFAEGALKAAHWIKGQPAGFYGMEDMLSLNT